MYLYSVKHLWFYTLNKAVVGLVHEIVFSLIQLNFCYFSETRILDNSQVFN